MLKYRLSENITVFPVSEYPFAQTPPDNWQGNYILYDGVRNKDYLINETFKYFLDKFSIPKMKSYVLKEIAAEVKTSVSEIEKSCNDFFRFLRKRRILVAENESEVVPDKTTFLQPGDQNERFIITQIKSSHQFVEVYLVTDKKDEQPYIIKLLNKNKTRTDERFDEELSELGKEYELLKKMRNVPFICNAYEWDSWNGECPFIRLEYINGKSLSAYIRQGAIINEEISIDLIGMLLKAFSALHEKGIVHGDIHPSNILVTNDGQIRIIDLGFSLEAGSEADELISIGGVNFYMPPERINITTINKYTREPDFYSDVYQLGLMIYLIIYNREPFTGYIWEDLAKNIKNQEAVFPHISYSGYPVSSSLVRLMKNCLYKKPAKRYSSAKEIETDFKKTVIPNPAVNYEMQ